MGICASQNAVILVMWVNLKPPWRMRRRSSDDIQPKIRETMHSALKGGWAILASILKDLTMWETVFAVVINTYVQKSCCLDWKCGRNMRYLTVLHKVHIRVYIQVHIQRGYTVDYSQRVACVIFLWWHRAIDKMPSFEILTKCFNFLIEIKNSKF